MNLVSPNSVFRQIIMVDATLKLDIIPLSNFASMPYALFLAGIAAIAGAGLGFNHVRTAAAHSPERVVEAAFILLSGVLIALVLAFLGHLFVGHQFSVDRKWGSLGSS